MAELRVANVSLRFGGLAVIDDVSFDVERGKLLALIGPNGAGKTSVFNCISGLYRPAAGSIRFRERELIGLKPHTIARLGVARTFQHGELFPHLTALENLLIGRHTRVRTGLLGEAVFSRRTRAEEVAHRRAVEEILDFVELGRYRHAPVGELPFGTQKLIGFARALALEAKVLLLDEPSAGLNRDEREDLARFILRIKHELGLAMVWIEHDMQMVADLADRVVVLNYGRLLAAGSPEQVLAEPAVVDAYLGPGRVSCEHR
ncbi:MAG TPA: ABC transporter ATP-binding protein [Burkholderiales bacterium]|jgi:branched-chain amino acid transport system ATP-binding protein